ncbi:MAG: hypothetical protein R8K53_07175, partial [Mariprofundaceae bacterium]
MKHTVWILGLLMLLPGCMNLKHYHEVIQTIDDVKTLEKTDQQHDQRINNLEKIVHELQSGLRTEIRDQGVTVEKASPESVRVTLPQSVLFPSGSIELND